MNYLLHLLIYLNIYVVLALSLNLVVGYCGMLTMAHAAYFAVGGYTYAILTLSFHWPFLPAVFASMGLCAVLSLAISLPAWRFRGDFFVLVTLAVQSFIFSLIYNWSSPNAPVGSIQNLTNGPFGISGVPRPEISGIQFDTIDSMAILSSVVAAIILLVSWRLNRSPWGRLLKCMRDDELAARGLGKNTRLAKLQVLAISCAFAGLAGVLYSSYVRYLDPSSASLNESILMLCMVLVGGVGNFRGPMVGAAVLLLIPEFLRFAHFPDAIAANVRLLAYGLLLMLMTHLRPQGIAGEYRIQ